MKQTRATSLSDKANKVSGMVRHSALSALCAVREMWWSAQLRLLPEKPVMINYFFWPRFRLYPFGQVAFLAFVRFFERRYLRFALPYVLPGMIAVDVGANIGLWSICLAQRVGRTGQVHAFEPNPRTLSLLRRNLALNNVQDTVLIHNMAVGDHPGKVVLTGTLSEGDADCFIQPHDSQKVLDNVHEVAICTLDQWADEFGLVNGIEFLKVDCEGYELFILRGAQNTLSHTKHSMIVCEINPEAFAQQGYSSSDLYDLLEQMGYTVGYLQGRSGKLLLARPPISFRGNVFALKGL